MTTADDSTSDDLRPTRRGLLKAAGVTAAAGLGVTFLEPARADAANGDPVYLGNVNVQTSPTVVTQSTDATTLAVLIDDHSGFSVGSTGQAAALGAWSHANAGLYAYTASASQPAVLAYNAGQGPSLLAGGSGRLQQAVRGTAGAPSFANATIGEQARDLLGDLYICTASGNPGTWERVTAVRSGYTGGALHFLSTPIRLLDTRASRPARQTPNARITNGGSIDVTVGGFTYGGVTVPAGVSGAFLNITVVGPSAAGYVTAYPKGATRPTVSTVDFAAHQTLANGAMVAAGTNAVTIYQAGSVCDLLVDMSAFVI